MIEKLLEYSSLIQSKPVPKYKRGIIEQISFDHKLIGLRGAKGVGKTTMLLQYLKELDMPLNEKVYCSLDNVLIGDKNLLQIVEEFKKIGVKTLVIDEIHYHKNFEQSLKVIYDYFDINIIFSGSSALQLDFSKADLSRRALVFDIPILSLKEYIELKTKKKLDFLTLEDILKDHYQIAHEIIASGINPLKYFKEYINSGAYPYFLESNKEKDYYLKLTNAINSVIESDLLYIFSITPSKIHILKKLLLIMCESTPGSLNLSAIARESNIDTKTLYNYITALEKGELVNLLYYNKKGNALFQKPDKILLNNPNLFKILCTNPNKGSIRESFFISMLKYKHSVKYSKQGDFLINDKYLFEVGGKKKKYTQIKDIENSFVVADDIEIGYKNKIPLWLFGFLY